MSAIRTTCAYCGVGCGISATVTGGRRVTITGDRAHPANFGKLCSKGTHLGETVGLEGRLLFPEIDGERASWEAALAHVAGRFAATVAQHGPDSVAFYVSGQLLTEDYYVANKLMKGFIGSSNIDTNSRLCMASAVAAHSRAFGEDVVPCTYDDLDEADLILLVGSNTAWCHPVIWQRIEAARATRGTRLIVVDPRRTETAEQADLHIPIAPDGDIALFNALLARMRDAGQVDERNLADRVDVPAGFWDSLSPDCDDAGFDELVDLLIACPRTVTLFSQGANQSVCGTDKGNAIINLHLATGRIGKPGMGPFSITGQPNAMGGREVGGLANMLACHLGFSDDHRAAVQDFWGAPGIAAGPGLKAVDMFSAVKAGRIKALWVMATNPAVSMPDVAFVREALAACDFVVVSDVIADTDTTRLAHVKLPALGWGEKDGTVTNSERRISRQRALFSAPGEARADWAIIADVARRMGFSGFDYANAAAVFREFAAMTQLSVARGLKLDLTDKASISDADYAAMEPFLWGGLQPLADGGFPTTDGRARIIAVTPPADAANDARYPFRLNTGRYRDQWHTMTRTGLSPRLSQHRREPLLEVHPDDAKAHGLTDGGLAIVATPSGKSLFRVRISVAQRPGDLFVPMHWTDRMSNGGRAGRLPDQSVDPVSGQPGFKNSAATIKPVTADWRAFIVSREDIAAPDVLYWAKSRVDHGWLVELAGAGSIDADALVRPSAGTRIEAADLARGMRRIVALDDAGRLDRALFVTRSGALPSRDWIAAQLGASGPLATELLAGRPSLPREDAGPIVCVCYNVGEKRIAAAAREQRLASVQAVGAALNAGTNCGSCRPAIARLLAAANSQQMATT